MNKWHLKIGCIGAVTLSCVLTALSLDHIPENKSDWTEQGVVLSSSGGWESKPGLGVCGAEKLNGTYYLFYLSGFDGCWNVDGGQNHASLGVATSPDGINFSKYADNPVLKPHDFVPVGAEEEGIRTAYVRYVPLKNKWYAYCGVESPGGSDNCSFGGGSNCGCDVGVDASVFLATSSDGLYWKNEGIVNGAYNGAENYASTFVFTDNTFYLWSHRAEGGCNRSASSGTDPKNLSKMGTCEALAWGWSSMSSYLHNDNNTVTLLYEPYNGCGNHPGLSNNNLYMSTVKLDDGMCNVINERKLWDNGKEDHALIKDTNEWKWYYSHAQYAGDKIRLRTSTIHQTMLTQPDFTALKMNAAQATITSLSGRIIAQMQLKQYASINSNLYLNKFDLPAGTYIIMISGNMAPEIKAFRITNK